MDKTELRNFCRRKIKNTPPKDFTEWGKMISDLIVETDEWKTAETVFAFVSLPDEIDTRYLIESALRRCGIADLFDAIFTCSEVGHGKDEPVIFRRAMERFGAQRSDTVIFEDAIHAIETAKKDGFTVAAVFDESEKRQDEVRALADCYITSFEHLEQFRAMTAAD